jgi:hypothetical protein
MQVRVLEIGGIAANALLAFAWHAKAFNLIRRRPKNMREPYSNPETNSHANARINGLSQQGLRFCKSFLSEVANR